MAFGQASGPPAGARQIEQLSDLLERAGFASFREARHPFGLNQRQAAGKFTVPEANELIERLEAAEVVRGADSDQPTNDPLQEGLGGVDDSVIVAELERRGWCCIPPVIDLP